MNFGAFAIMQNQKREKDRDEMALKIDENAR
jgi:hypothetical protein